MTVVGFIGISIPDFFLALILMLLGSQGRFHIHRRAVFVSVQAFHGASPNSQTSSGTSGCPLLWWAWGTWGLMRVMRGNMLDVLGSPFITSLRAYGLDERTVKRHAVKNALNPMVSIAGAELPNIFSGTIIAAIVLNLPTMGPFFYNALLNHDQYLVMAFLMFIALITQIGNLLADIALAFLDPRIRMS